MKKIILTLIFILICGSQAHALFWRAFTSLTGDIAGSVDHAECDELGTSLDDGMGMVVTSAGDVYFYYFDRSDTTATSSPDYIRCKDDSFTSGVWILASTGGGGSGTVDTSGTPVDNDWARFTDADTIEGRSDTEIKQDLNLVVGTNVQADLDLPSDSEVTTGTSTTERVWSSAKVKLAAETHGSGGSVTNPLTADLDVGSYEIESSGTDDIVIRLPDTAGARKIIVKDSAGATVWELDSDGVQNPDSTPSASWRDNDTGNIAFSISGNDAGTYSDTSIKTRSGSAETEMILLNGQDGEVNIEKPLTAARKIIEANTTSADDSSLTAADLFGSEVWVSRTSGNYDLILPDCGTGVADLTHHLRVCQRWQSQTVSIAPASGDDFKLSNNTNTTAGNELDSPGAASTYQCVDLVCLGSSDRWLIANETGRYGLSTTWTDGGAAD